MRKYRLLPLLFAMTALLFSCGGPRVAPGPKPPEVCQAPAKPAEPEPVVVELEEVFEEEPQEDTAAVARAGALERLRRERIYFAFDSDEILPESRENLVEIAAILEEYPDISLEIQGHCDERGSVEYNLALALRRAEAAMRFLEGQGVDGERLSVSAQGKETPLVEGHSEEAYAKNRRCEFIVTEGGPEEGPENPDEEGVDASSFTSSNLFTGKLKCNTVKL